MTNPVPDTIICLIALSSMASVWVVSNLLRDVLGGDSLRSRHLSLSQLIDEHAITYGWALKFSVNCFAYASVFVPGFIVYQYTSRIKYLERCANKSSWMPRTVALCFGGRLYDSTDKEDPLLRVQSISPQSGGPSSNRTPSKSSSDIATAATTKDAILMTYCFLGLMASYLTWGLLQEKIMTQEYRSVVAETGVQIVAHYQDSQFLVFANRALAFVIALVYLRIKRDTIVRHSAPLYKYSYASFSNIMSAWFQYEALKFVNFPTQVLAKSCKIIPVMLMGKIVSRTKYEFYEYLTAVLISLGMMFFMLGNSSSTGHAYSGSSIASMTGILLLVLYMLFDSFTSNWQSDLFKTYGMSSIQMMCGVNLFSSLFTAVSLSLQGGFFDSMVFGSEHPKFIFDCVVLSISSAVGQLFIFYTIAKFGPVVFTIIMTLRQAIAILLSCMVYNHAITNLGILGVMVVFFAIFLRIYCSQRLKQLRRRGESNRPRTVGI